MKGRLCFSTHHYPNIKTKYRNYKEIKLLINIPHEHICKNSKHHFNKSNSTIYKKYTMSRSSGVYPKNANIQKLSQMDHRPKCKIPPLTQDS